MMLLPRIVLAGTGSGCGKTSVACGVLGALSRRRKRVRAFKCGPDYIDPMFHEKMLGIPSRNLDLFLCGEEGVRRLLAKNGAGASVAVMEGVMGFYDGVAATDYASTSHLSRVVEAPVILVADARGKALSLAAEVKGFLDFAPNRIRGVILNNAPTKLEPMYRELAKGWRAELLGCFPPLPGAALESRHLGLVTAGEVEGIRGKLDLLAEAAEAYLDLDRLMDLAAAVPPLPVVEHAMARGARVRVGVAADAAFCFYYRDGLDLLEELGAELVPFSPLEDGELPQGLEGLWLGGGYPELHAGRLSANRSMRESVRSAVEGGLPTVAECGGFLYLCKELVTGGGERFPMAGALPGAVRMTGRLARFGYARLTARRDNLLCREGESFPVHEFHYSQADRPGEDFVAQKPGREERWDCVHAHKTLWAGYPHVHLWSNPSMAQRFLDRCRAGKTE